MLPTWNAYKTSIFTIEGGDEAVRFVRVHQETEIKTTNQRLARRERREIVCTLSSLEFFDSGSDANTLQGGCFMFQETTI